jgi:hypothetical protein
VTSHRILRWDGTSWSECACDAHSSYVCAKECRHVNACRHTVRLDESLICHALAPHIPFTGEMEPVVYEYTIARAWCDDLLCRFLPSLLTKAAHTLCAPFILLSHCTFSASASIYTPRLVMPPCCVVHVVICRALDYDNVYGEWSVQLWLWLYAIRDQIARNRPNLFFRCCHCWHACCVLGRLGQCVSDSPLACRCRQGRGPTPAVICDVAECQALKKLV